MILNVPYKSQKDIENGGVRKWCGIACLWMVMTYYLKDQTSTIEQLLTKYGSQFEEGGFTHKDLLKIARDHHLRGFRKSWWVQPGVEPLLERFRAEGETVKDIEDWEKTNLEEALYTIESFVNQGIPVILSVSKDFSPSQATHLVVLVGVENNNFIIHDPYKKGANYKISKEEFKRYSLKQAIVILPVQKV